MRKSWRWILGIVAVFVASIVLLAIFFDWNWLKPPLEAHLSSLTGKTVRIEGPLTGRWGWVSTVTADHVVITAPDWKPDPKVASIDRIGVSVDLRRLLVGTLSFPRIDIVRPVLDLQRAPDGHANWDIAREAGGPSSRSAMPIIGTLSIKDGTVGYRDPAKHVEIDARITTVTADGGSGDDALTLQGHGTYGKAPFTIRLKGGSIEALRNTRKPYDLDAGASVGNTKVTIDGTVTDPFKLAGMNVKLTAQGDNAEELYPLFGVPAPSTPPYHLAGTLDRQGSVWLFKNFAGTVGNSDLGGSLRFEPARPRLFVSGNLVSKRLDFADLGLLVGAPGSTDPGRPVSEQQRRMAKEYAESDRVLPNAPLNLDEVRSVDADITFKGDHIEAKTLPLEDTDFHLVLDNAVLKLDPLRIGVAGGRIDSAIAIDARNEPVETDYDLHFHRFQLQQFFARAGFPNGGSGVIDGRVRLHGTGNSVRRSLGTANGEIGAIIDNGTLSELASDLLGLDVARALGLLISGDQQIPLRCFVTDFQVQNGVMQPRIFLLDTSETMVTGKGTIDLGSERLDLSLAGEPKKASPVSLGGPIEVGGTFKHPSVGLGAEAVARGGAAVALGALLTPLASLLGFLDTGQAADPDCVALEHESQANAAKPPPGAARHHTGSSH
jgi:uncharacterized protein involved in outer membrane biogenesis